MASKNSPEKYSNDGALGCLSRLYWMFAGNVVILFAAVSIALSKDQSFLTVLDWVFIDIKYFKGSGPDGQPATMQDFGKYFRNVLIMSGITWGLAHFLNRL